MAREIWIQGEHYKRRNIFAVWIGLPFITLGIYTFVWYYKINNEARRFLRDPSIRPALSVLAILFGWIIIVPPFVSTYRTAGRVRRMQEQVGLTTFISPVLATVLLVVFNLHRLYLQNELNRVWDRYP